MKKPKAKTKRSKTFKKFTRRAPRARAVPPTAPLASAAEMLEVARLLSAHAHVDDLLKKIVQATERLTGAEGASLLLLDEDGRRLCFKTATGDTGTVVEKMALPADQGVAGWVLQNDRSVNIPDVQKDTRFSGGTDRVTGIVTRSLLAVPFRINGKVAGVCEAIHRRRGAFTARDQKALEEMAALAAVSVDNARRAETQNNFFDHAIEILVSAIEATHTNYLGHPSRVAEISAALGRRLGVEGEAAENLRYGALLHDVGRIAMNHRDLAARPAGSLSEKALAEAHVLLGAQLLEGIKRFKGVTPIVRHHHEHWDGTGYPDRLVGEQIPLGARIVALVEDLEELRFSSLPEADLKPLLLQRAKNGSGTLFDPAVVEAYLSLEASSAVVPPVLF